MSLWHVKCLQEAAHAGRLAVGAVRLKCQGVVLSLQGLLVPVSSDPTRVGGVCPLQGQDLKRVSRSQPANRCTSWLLGPGQPTSPNRSTSVRTVLTCVLSIFGMLLVSSYFGSCDAILMCNLFASSQCSPGGIDRDNEMHVMQHNRFYGEPIIVVFLGRCSRDT